MKKFLCNRVLFCLLVFLLSTPLFSIPFADFDFDSAELNEEIALDFDEFTITIYDIKKKGDSLSCSADLHLGNDQNYAELTFPQFTLNRDGSFKSGYTSNEAGDSFYYHEGKTFCLFKAYLEKSAESCLLVCKKAKVEVPWAFGYKFLLTGQITVDMHGNLLSIKPSMPKNLKLATNDDFNTFVNLDSIIYDENNVIRANGEISLPNLNLHISAKNHEIYYSDYAFIAAFDQPFTFSYGSDTFTAKSITLQSKSKSKYWFDDVILTHDNIEYPLGKVDYLSYGGNPPELDSAWIEGNVEGVSFLLPDDQVQKYCYSNGGLTVIFLSRFPLAKEHYLKVGATIKPDKIDYYIPSPKEEKGLWYGDFYVKAENELFQLKETLLRYNEETEEFEISRGKVFCPKNCALCNFVFIFAAIDKKGNFYFNGELPKIIDFCNNAFEPKTIKFTDEGLLLTGTLILNTYSRGIPVNELLIAYDGRVKSFKTSPLGYDENTIAREFYVTSQSSYLMVEQEQYPDGTLSKPILWQVFEDSQISTDKIPRPLPINDLRRNHTENSLRFYSKEYPFEKYYKRLEGEDRGR